MPCHKKSKPGSHTSTLCLNWSASELHGWTRFTDEQQPVYLDTINAAAVALIDEARFRIPGWKLTPQDIQVIENCIKRLIQEGKVRDHRFDKPLPSLGLQSAVLIAHKHILRAIQTPRKVDGYHRQSATHLVSIGRNWSTSW